MSLADYSLSIDWTRDADADDHEILALAARLVRSRQRPRTGQED
jgi:hypothetical protein